MLLAIKQLSLNIQLSRYIEIAIITLVITRITWRATKCARLDEFVSIKMSFGVRAHSLITKCDRELWPFRDKCLGPASVTSNPLIHGKFTIKREQTFPPTDMGDCINIHSRAVH